MVSFKRGKTKEAGSWRSEMVPVKYEIVDCLYIRVLSWSMGEWIEFVVGRLYSLRKLCLLFACG